MEKGAEELHLHPPPRRPGSMDDPAKGNPMIIFVRVNLKHLFKHQRNYPWARPACCPRCEMSQLWGHGFVLAYFDGLPAGVFLRRYRCPQCGCVIRVRPKGYFPRFQAAICVIRASLSRRISASGYLPKISSSRQRHWLKALKRHVTARLGNPWGSRLLAAFDLLVAAGHVPVSCAI